MLPIGLIVKTKFSKNDSKLIIVSIMPESTISGEKGYYDYGAFLYPIGQMGDKMAFFNDADVTEVIYKGYEDDQWRKFDEYVVGQINKREIKIPHLTAKEREE
ncbi:DUF4176 domain-containing protein [Ligilactobacillus sp. LYQ60]|uniref:DUF4176 domain-containing protein n=1 Tax=unclassified Ligilactobacillus TaxID=2767920 RepID=UPI0038527AC9